jgi:hypothetical protein
MPHRRIDQADQQTRAEWETPWRMEKMGVTLSDDEKIVLIDYLIGTDEP